MSSFAITNKIHILSTRKLRTSGNVWSGFRHTVSRSIANSSGGKSLLLRQKANKFNNFHPWCGNHSSLPLKSLRISSGISSKMEPVRAAAATRTFPGTGTKQQVKPKEGKQERRKGKRREESMDGDAGDIVKSSLSYLQILGTGLDTEDTAPSVLLFFENRRYIFNAGEGMQRFCLQHKVRFTRVDSVFLTRVNSETAGGLPGFLLTLASQTNSTVRVCGPSNLSKLFEAMDTFIPQAASVQSSSFGQSGEDREPGRLIEVMDEPGIVKISAIVLHADLPVSDVSQRGGSGKAAFKRQRSWEGASSGADMAAKSADKAEEGSSADASVVYVCQLPSTQGKFDPKKALELGLRPGPKYGLLQRGQSVATEDGSTTIHPSDVMSAPVAGAVLLLVDCPSDAHFRQLRQASALAPFYSSHGGLQVPAGSPSTVTLVVHLGPAAVTGSHGYRQWMASFGSTTQHIMAGHGREESVPPILFSSARVTTNLNYVFPRLFPAVGLGLPDWESGPTVLEGSPQASEKGQAECVPSPPHLGPLILSQNLMKFNLRPQAMAGIDSSCVPSQESPIRLRRDLERNQPEVFHLASEAARLWESTAASLALNSAADSTGGREYRESMEDGWISCGPAASLVESEDPPLVPECVRSSDRRQMEVVFLGTGSSMPSKHRNVSAIHINLFARGGVLLDCGEGTYGQLRRRYGREGADAAIAGLGLIWISHIHADHHVGILRILAVRRALLLQKQWQKQLAATECPPLLVVGPTQLLRFLEAYEKLEPLSYTFLDCRATCSTQKQGSLLKTGPRSYVSGLTPFWMRTQPGGEDSRVAVRQLEEALERMGLQSLQSVPVVHCRYAYGVVLESRPVEGREQGWKLVYSGDTRPCDSLVEASRGATLLIHEATFEDEMQADAVSKRHSTTKEAIETGMAADVYRIILTHFSQRYPKIPVIDTSFTDRTCIAFDMMSVNLVDLPVLPQLLPSMRSLFKDELVADEDIE